MLVFHGHDWTTSAIFWGAIVAVVFFSSFFRYRERAHRYRAIEKMAEAGQAVPPEMLYSRHRDYRDDHRYYGSPIWHGLTLMFIGVALFLFFWAMTGGGNYFDGEHVPHWLPFVGIFPFMIGLARFLAGLFNRPPKQ
jgi:O-antigen/teichoic acid export membrane protein